MNPEKLAKKAAKLAKFQAKQSSSSPSPSSSSTTPSSSVLPPPAPKPNAQKPTIAPATNIYNHPTTFPPTYSPLIEEGITKFWEQQNYAAPRGNTAQKFIIAMPPPNVTGALHLGHANTTAIQDALTRYHRMKGHTTLWNPGSDHAGIATQAVVEKKLKKEKNLTRHEIGREAMVKEIWDYTDTFKARIKGQIRQLGASCDWNKVAFTLDPKLCKAVSTAFTRLHKEGVIYRANKLVNWSCKLSTALSNIEVNSMELTGPTKIAVPGHLKKYEFGVIITFAYPLENSDDKIHVATTRIETMLGDTAICVHPEDERFTKYHGKFAIHPFSCRRIPIIPDTMVEREFGTGAVKITPAHDPNDFAVGKRHNLEFINVLDDQGAINENGGEYKEMMRFDARLAIIKALTEKGLYIETKANPMSLKICSRSGDVIEPLLKPQWWMNCDEPAKAAIEAVKSGKLKILPKTAENEWFRWLENIQDWCLSRQLWWGHRIPAYLIHIKGVAQDSNENKNWVSGMTMEEALANAQALFPNVSGSDITLTQDPDVFDTWFSSGLWPFSIFGWPDQTEDMKLYYPNSLLETGQDIIFFWVARMVMLGIKLTGQVPFKEVFCHSMVRDAHGAKMSKSSGNVVDPSDVIKGITLEKLHAQLLTGNLDEKEISKAKAGQKANFPRGIPQCGADALRFGLLSYTCGGSSVNMDILRIDAYRKFCNKLWNATRFALMKLDIIKMGAENFDQSAFKPASKAMDIAPESLADRWILSRLNHAITGIDAALLEYNFMNATSIIYNFWLYELCDVYIEAIKPICEHELAQDKTTKEFTAKVAAQNTLYTCLDQGLKLMHPFMPFVTEELWQKLPRRESETISSVMISEWPTVMKVDWTSEDADHMTLLQDVIKGIRSVASDAGIKSAAEVHIMQSNNSIITSEQQMIKTLSGKNNNVSIHDTEEFDRLAEGMNSITIKDVKVYVKQGEVQKSAQ